MPKALKNTLFSVRDILMSFGPYVLSVLLVLILAYWWMNPTPPQHVTLATGPDQSAYAEFGKQYAAWLKPYGITVKLRATEGSTENLQLLRDGKVNLGFVQGGTSNARAQDEDSLASLGSLFVEPIWVFYRETAINRNAFNSTKKEAHKELTSLAQLKGLRVNWDTVGSGVPNLMKRMLDLNHIDPATMSISEMDDTPAAIALIAGEIDVIALAQAPESLIVQMLLMTPGIKLMDFAQNEAYSRRFPFLSPVVLPRGVVDLAQDVPRDNIHLVAPTTSLIANSNTHPALLHLFSMATHNLHGSSGWFNKAYEYPNAKRDELPIAAEADRYIKNGAPFLQRHLPFWAANLIDRMWVVVGILLAVLLPLSKILPPLYKFRIRRRIFQSYSRLREIEDSDKPNETLLKELEALDKRTESIDVPLSYADELYSLRSNIQLVRKKLLRT
jgi:NMT1-like family